MNITIQYFAHLRETRGLSEESIQTSSKTVKDLYLELKNKHQFELEVHDLKVAKDDAFCAWETELVEGDTITYLPPVGGG